MLKEIAIPIIFFIGLSSSFILILLYGEIKRLKARLKSFD